MKQSNHTCKNQPSQIKSVLLPNLPLKISRLKSSADQTLLVVRNQYARIHFLALFTQTCSIMRRMKSTPELTFSSIMFDHVWVKRAKEWVQVYWFLTTFVCHQNCHSTKINSINKIKMPPRSPSRTTESTATHFQPTSLTASSNNGTPTNQAHKYPQLIKSMEKSSADPW